MKSMNLKKNAAFTKTGSLVKCHSFTNSRIQTHGTYSECKKQNGFIDFFFS